MFDLKDMTEIKQKADKKALQDAVKNKAMISNLNSGLAKLNLEMDALKEENLKLEVNHKKLSNENNKMKNRIVKMKQKKGKIDRDVKMCKHCSKEYADKENFNWSCRTHRYEFSGEMWWCCGKRGVD